MPHVIPSAIITLSIPLYACDFDPLDDTRLLVGGGGGASKTGVGNKIICLDASNPNELVEAGEIVLSTDEDNVTSLAVGQKRDKKTLVYAGVNSSPEDVARGNNRHFRTFGLEEFTNAQKLKAGRFSEISRTSMFQGKEPNTYQRITRLSKPFKGYVQLGGVATGEAKTAQTMVFDTSATTPPISRGTVQSNKETVDLDLLQIGDDEYMFAYCDIYDLYIKKISLSKGSDSAEPECVYITPASRGTEKVTLPSFRALRWLTKDLIIMLTNIHSSGGVVLQILRTPPSGKGQSRIVQSHRLPDSMKKATGLAVANLTPPLTPSDPQGYTQFVIAVAGQDFSIHLFKVDLQAELNVSMVMKIKPFRTFKKVHPNVITGIAFSNFTPPTHPVTASTPPQHLKLASVSVALTTVVHTIPLFPVPLSVKRGQSKTPRYVVALPSTAAAFGFSVGLSVIGIAIAAILIQAILEIRGGVPTYLNARNHLPVIWQEALGRPYEFPPGYNDISSVVSSDIPKATDYVPTPDIKRKTGFFDKLKQGTSHGIYLLKEGAGDVVGVQLHDEKQQGAHGGKTWDDLDDKQKQLWKRKLKDAGHWAEDMGETILKGVLFGEIAGAVGRAVAGG